MFIVPSSLPVKNVAEFVALAKSKPGTLTYGHPGKGSTGHLGFELFKRIAGVDVTGVGYRGYPQMVPDIASGLINSSFFSVNQALGQVQSGAVRIIATINDGRTNYFPDAPTMAEQGFPDAQVTPWFGIVVPKGTPQPIVERIDKALEAALASSEVREKLDTAGCEAKSAPLRPLPTSSNPTSRCGRRSSRRPASPRIEHFPRRQPPWSAGNPPCLAKTGEAGGDVAQKLLLVAAHVGGGRDRGEGDAFQAPELAVPAEGGQPRRPQHRGRAQREWAAALADGARQAVAPGEPRMMAGGAGNGSRGRQQGVEKQPAAELGLLGGIGVVGGKRYARGPRKRGHAGGPVAVGCMQTGGLQDDQGKRPNEPKPGYERWAESAPCRAQRRPV